MNIDARILEHFNELIAFNPDSATDEERAALIKKGMDLIEQKTTAKPETMEDIARKHASRVKTGSVRVPKYLKADIEVTRSAVKEMMETRKATVDAYKKGAQAVLTTLIKVALLP